MLCTPVDRTLRISQDGAEAAQGWVVPLCHQTALPLSPSRCRPRSRAAAAGGFCSAASALQNELFP